MSLFGTIQLASNALNVASLGLQVTGNNIANASTPDYIASLIPRSTGPMYSRGILPPTIRSTNS